MIDWWKDIKRVLWTVVLVSSILFILFIINQFILLYQFIALLHPGAAVVTIAGIALALIYIIARLIHQLWLAPRPLELPEDAAEEEYQKYLTEVLNLLRRNPNLADLNLDDETIPLKERVELGFNTLETQTLPLIKQNANAIFLSTAISQNGALDSLVVLFSLFRMVWQLAKVYRTRPSLKSLGKLYLEVASVVLMARTMEDADLIESQLEPLISAILGESIASAIPGMVPVTNLVISSLMEGAINSYLTLRVGIVAQDYLSIYQPHNKQLIRRSAAVESLTYMRDIIKDNSKTVIKTVGNAVRNAGVGTAKRWFNFADKK